MKDNRDNSPCCGGGGGGDFLDIQARPRLSWVRVRQAVDAGAGVIAVACPFCRTMLENVVKTMDAGLEVKHASEILREVITE